MFCFRFVLFSLSFEISAAKNGKVFELTPRRLLEDLQQIVSSYVSAMIHQKCYVTEHETFSGNPSNHQNFKVLVLRNHKIAGMQVFPLEVVWWGRL